MRLVRTGLRLIDKRRRIELEIKRQYKVPVNPLVSAEFKSTEGVSCRLVDSTDMYVYSDYPVLEFWIGVDIEGEERIVSFDKSDLKDLINLLQEFHDQMEPFEGEVL